MDLKLEFTWDTERNEPKLLLDGADHDSLPWISPDFRLDEKELPIYYAELLISGQYVTTYEEPFEWEPHVLQHKIFEQIGTNEVKDFMIGV